MYDNDELVLIFESIATEILKSEDTLSKNIADDEKEEITEKLKKLRSLRRKTETYMDK